MKKVIGTGLAGIIFMLGLWQYSSCTGLYGVWVNPHPQAGNIFQGNIEIEKIKNDKEKSQHDSFTLIYDKTEHALSCTNYEKDDDLLLCLPILRQDISINRKTTYKEVEKETTMMPLFLKIKRQDYLFYHVLDMEMSFVSPTCERFGEKGCNYIKFPRYTRWGI